MTRPNQGGQMSEDRLIGEKKGNIFYITLNRPGKRNAS
jgi:enoyl-CoA hydratase/carnithine racemase